ncbi:MAG: hypothetical protein JWO57_1014, partial [Pseudonocardiales bacterium]|nr:hypothetical protein [Pseudonocardiales bacterium]
MLRQAVGVTRTSPQPPDHSVPVLGRRLFAEFLGTGLLVAVVVGSGIAA